MEEKSKDGCVALRYETPELRVSRASRGGLMAASPLTGVVPAGEGYGDEGLFGSWANGFDGAVLNEGYGDYGSLGSWAGGVDGAVLNEGYGDYGSLGSWEGPNGVNGAALEGYGGLGGFGGWDGGVSGASGGPEGPEGYAEGGSGSWGL